MSVFGTHPTDPHLKDVRIADGLPTDPRMGCGSVRMGRIGHPVSGRRTLSTTTPGTDLRRVLTANPDVPEGSPDA